MKTMKLSLAMLGMVAVFGLFAFNVMVGGSIKGTVSPAEGGVRAWAFAGTDTLKAQVTGGVFEIADAKPGTYTVIIQAAKPYKNTVKEGVQVKDGEITDLGEIKMEK